MGFLDSSTNNIILDAVLTDLGRAMLARNDGSFSIVKFALGDDGVDYSIIQKFGRTVGKEKIEKNTPILEASTNGNIALKHRLVTISNPNLLRMPTLSLTGESFDSSTNILSMNRTGNGSSRTLTLSQAISNESSIDVEVRDQLFVVKVNNLFLQVTGTIPDVIDNDNIATYLLTRDSTTTSTGGSQLTMTLSVKSLSDNHFTVFGRVVDKNTIGTVIQVSGVNSGAMKEFTVNIAK